HTPAASVGVKMPNLRPKRMIPGRSSAQMPSANARVSSPTDFFGGGVMFSVRVTHHHATASPAPIMIPGMIPARKSLEIEQFAATPNTMKPILGGMIGPMIPLAGLRPQ